MKRMWFIVVTFSLSAAVGFGQALMPVLDMTVEELQKEEASWDQRDTNRRVDVLNELAFKWRNIGAKRDSARLIALEAQQLANLNDYLIGKVDASMRLGLLEEKNGKLHEAVTYYEEALRLRRDSLKRWSQAASVCNNLGNVYKQQKNGIDKAINYYKQGLDLLENEADGAPKFRVQAMLMNNLGELLTNIAEYKTAQLYINNSLSIRETLADTVGIANVLLNRGLLFKRMTNTERSNADFLLALALFQKKNDSTGIGKCLLALGDNHVIRDSFKLALEHYNNALTYAGNLEDDDIANIYLGRGISYFNLNNPAAAKENYSAALKLYEQANDDNGRALVYLNYGSYYKKEKAYKEAIDHYKKSLSYIGEKADITIKYNLLDFLAQSYSALELKDSALSYTRASAQFRDDLADSHRDALTVQYNMAVLENENKQLKIEKAEEDQKRMQIYLIVVGLMLGLALTLYYTARQRRRLAEQEVRLSIQQLALSQQELIDVMRDKELETNYARLSGIETARKKIGQELHDNVGSMLSTVKMYFSSIDNRMDSIQEENRRQYQKANALLDQACDEVRRLSHEMVSAILMKFGLKAQLESLAETLQNTGKLEVELATFGLKERLDNQTEINIYRMIQEMVNNVIKHANATKISIQVNRFEEMVNIMVEDNGVGFEVEKIEGGIGLVNLRARVHELAGRLNIDSTPGKGTSISVDIPVEQEVPLTIKAN